MRSMALCAVTCGMMVCAAGFAQPAPSDDRYVTREEYERLLKRLDSVTTELQTVKAQTLQQNTAPTRPTRSPSRARRKAGRRAAPMKGEPLSAAAR